MSAYLSNILTNTTSRYNSLRRTLLSNEDDGDTEDDSHISRVLRAYYTEKGRPFPPWLPPDPNERNRPTLANQQPSSSYFSRPVASLQAQYSSSASTTAGQPRTSLSDLWDTPSAGPPTTTGPQSLRAARRPPGAASTPPPQQLQGQGQAGFLAPPSARPLPSQRAGSYQSQRSGVGGYGSYDGSQSQPQPPPTPGGGAGTAQDRLKAKLWGAWARGPSPGPSPMGPREPGGYDQQGQQQQQGRRW